MSKNIQEYVARSVIEHMKYRDEKIIHLEDVLKKYRIIKCPNCNEYTDELVYCYSMDIYVLMVAKNIKMIK